MAWLIMLLMSGDVLVRPKLDYPVGENFNVMWMILRVTKKIAIHESHIKRNRVLNFLIAAELIGNCEFFNIRTKTQEILWQKISSAKRKTKMSFPFSSKWLVFDKTFLVWIKEIWKLNNFHNFVPKYYKKVNCQKTLDVKAYIKVSFQIILESYVQ